MSIDRPTSLELARVLLVAANDVERAMAVALRDTGLGVPHYLVLTHLARHGAAPTSNLAQVAAVPPATLTRTLDKLVDLALVYRSLDDFDRRRILIYPTTRGLTKAEECESSIDGVIADFLPDLRDWETQALIELLSTRRALIGRIVEAPGT